MYEGFNQALEECNGSSITMDARVYDLLQKQHNKILELQDLIVKMQKVIDTGDALINKDKEIITAQNELIEQFRQALGLDEVVA